MKGSSESIIRTLTQSNKPDFIPEEGPLLKSFYTIQLENIFRKVLTHYPLTLLEMKDGVWIFIDGISCNLSDMIKFANLDHIELNQNDFIKYHGYGWNANSLLHKDAYEDELNDRDLSQEEMHALNIYTQGSDKSGNPQYKQINELLRGALFPTIAYSSANNYEKFRVPFVHAIMCASALHKTHRSNLSRDKVSRHLFLSQDTLEKWQQSIDLNEPIVMNGLVSTTAGGKIDIGKLEKISGNYGTTHVLLVLTNIRGYCIDSHSHSKSENEVLLLPVQVLLESSSQKDGALCFKGHVVADLRKIHAESQCMTHPYLLQAIKSTPKTSDFINLSRNRLQFMAIQELTQALQAIPSHVKRLDLSENLFLDRTPEEQEAILNAIPDTVSELILEKQCVLKNTQVNTYNEQLREFQKQYQEQIHKNENFLTFIAKFNETNSSLDELIAQIKNGADVNATNAEGKPVLAIAYACERVEVIDVLLENGADIVSMLRYVIEEERDAFVLKWLFKNEKFKMKFIDKLDHNDPEIRQLLENKYQGIPSNKILCQHVIKEVAEQRVKEAMDIISASETLITQEMRILRNKMLRRELEKLSPSVDTVEALLSQGADANSSYNGTPLLISAVKAGQTQIGRLLLEHGANVNAHTLDNKTTALILAAKNGDLTMVEMLVRQGAKLEDKDAQNNTALMQAIACNHPSVISFLSEQANLQEETPDSESPNSAPQ